MEAASILGSLQSRTAIMPGGRDREKRPLVLVPVPVETTVATTTSYNSEQLDTCLRYYLSILSAESRRQGLTVVVDGQRSSWRLVRLIARQVSCVLGPSLISFIVLRPDAFWDKQRVDTCARIHKDGEPTYITFGRLNKYVDSSQLPEELCGTWVYDHDLWIQNRIQVEDFLKGAERGVSELERVRQRVSGPKQGIRLSTAEETLAESSYLFTDTKELAQRVLQAGQSLLERVEKDVGLSRGAMTPQDTLDTKERVERLLEIIEGKLVLVQEAWEDVQKRIVDAKEVHTLEDGVKRVTDWILGTGETMLNAQQEVGYDISSAEELRSDHEALELQCRETYGHYAELLHKIDTLAQNGITLQEDLKSQRDFMDFVCRSFATRLERRRNVLITSTRFFRLVTEYFQMTSEVYENLVMCTNVESLDSAHCTLLELQESQADIDLVETALVREGEKLSDLLSMPVKDALGRELEVCYEGDIVNAREILDMTTARRQLFRDSVELQRLTLQQATHIHDYEQDASQAVQWLDDLFQVMLKTHSHVGCNVFEIQTQKEEHQSFQETAKGTYEYGCQLVSAALTLRQSCKLPVESNTALSHSLWQAWTRLHTVGQEQMTRLRVSAVFHRSVHQHCKQLLELTAAVKCIAAEEDAARRRSKIRKLFASRERLLLEVGRMVRLGRLLRTRLREPLSPDQMSDSETSMEVNAIAVEAISAKLTEVTALAEQLDSALCGSDIPGTGSTALASPNINRILDGTAATTPEEWYSTINKAGGVVKSSSSTSNGAMSTEDCSKSEEEFVTASECTCTPPSRSSSFHTASEGEPASPWWEQDIGSETEDQPKESSAVAIKSVSPQDDDDVDDQGETNIVIQEEVIQTHHLKLSHDSDYTSIPSPTPHKMKPELYLIEPLRNQPSPVVLQHHESPDGAESNEASKRMSDESSEPLLENIKEVGQQPTEASGELFFYNQQNITRHALAGVF